MSLISIRFPSCSQFRTIRDGADSCRRAGLRPNCEQQFQKAAHRAAERWAKSAQPHLEQARRALNLRGDLQLQCEVTHAEQDNGLPMVTAEAKFFTEKRPSGYGGFTYADEVELNFEITLAQMVEDGDEAEQAWRALQTSRQTCQQQTDLLIAWRKKLAEIPYVQRQAKAHLTDVLLQQTEPGRQLYQTLQGQFQDSSNCALCPMRTGDTCPTPPASTGCQVTAVTVFWSCRCLWSRQKNN